MARALAAKPRYVPQKPRWKFPMFVGALLGRTSGGLQVLVENSDVALFSGYMVENFPFYSIQNA